MSHETKRTGPADKPAKKVEKKEALKRLPEAPTARQIEQSITNGTSVPLTEFVKGVKL